MTERDLFLAALELDPGDRAAYLDRECGGDPAFRDRVAALLAAHTASGAFMDRPAAGPTIDHPAAAAGAVLGGRYTLREQIGEGGFGLVFVADQTEPVRRKVAVKVLKPGMDTREVVARFEAERQALALMDHPHIAKVHDAGATPEGRPYFVMELVKGVPITDYCDGQKLPPRQRLELFVQVCRAVQHAHQKGVIHRDLKPSNILVAPHDGVPVVKVIDFGIAKALGPALTDKTVYTRFAQMIGTPLYMSPEQAEVNQLDVDTRSDIYSLGVLLYELLTGTTPFGPDRFQAAGFDEIRRIIREEDPPKPSTRLSTLGPVAETVSANRGTDARRLAGLVRGELDWVVMKCLEKDRTRRYDAAGALAADVERYLADEPVLACPPSVGYRVRKFARRNRAALGTAGLVVLALLAGLAGTSWGMVRADRHRRDAEENARQARAAAVAERAAREGFARREAAARAMLAFLEKRILSAARPAGQDDGLGGDVTLRRALELALPFLDRGFPDEPVIEARLRNTLGVSFQQLGDAKTAAAQFEKARALYVAHLGPADPDTLRATLNLAISYAALGRRDEALRLEEEAVPPLAAALGETDPEVLQAMNNLGASYLAAGKAAEARRLHERVLAARTAARGLDDPDTLRAAHNLANDLVALGEHGAALTLREDVLPRFQASLDPKHPDTLAAAYNLANSYERANRHKDALERHKTTFEGRRERLQPGHPDTLRRATSLGWAYCRADKFDDALPLFEEVVAQRTEKFPADVPALLLAKWGQAMCLVHRNRGAEAIPIIDECVIRAAGQAVDPHLVAGVMKLRLRHYRRAGDPAGLRATAEMWERLNQTDPDSLYLAARMWAAAAAVQKDPAASRADADRAMDWLRKAVAAGRADVAELKSDRALAGRADFRRLVTELEATPKGGR